MRYLRHFVHNLEINLLFDTLFEGTEHKKSPSDAI